MRGTVEERFFAKVEKTDTCWNWIGAKNPRGYGSMNIGGRPENGGRTASAHRVAYELAYGSIPEGLHIDHICHNRARVNPDHLRPVTHKQNHENLSGARSTSQSGVLGIFWNPDCKKWGAKVVHNRKPHYLGVFEDIKDAEAAVIAKRNELFTHNNLDRAA